MFTDPNCPHICLEHRLVARATKWVTRHCPVDGTPMIKFNPATEVPKKSDDRGWAKLMERYQAGQRWRTIEDYARHTGQGAYAVKMRMQRSERLLERWRSR